MSRYKLTLAYDGTAFFGSQRQAHRRTVQAELEKAARRLGWKGTGILLAGRTDSGVHATGQIAALDLSWMHPPEALRDALNASLPRDLVVSEVESVADGFHPRFDATRRRYRYDVRCDQIRHPLADRMAWRVWPAVCVGALNLVARRFLGQHDFGAFGSASRKGAGTVRTVYGSKWTSADDLLRYEISADGFLYRMVRRLVFVQVALQQGRCSEQALWDALENGQRGRDVPAGTAPAAGLVLVEVTF
jgi:tRNA pseudouridine38-40 synthase